MTPWISQTEMNYEPARSLLVINAKRKLILIRILLLEILKLPKYSICLEMLEKNLQKVRFRIGYLILLRLATHPREGISLWDKQWKNIRPSGFIVHNALVLMGEASNENLEDRAEFSDELLDSAEKWMAEHPLPDP